jgi:phospholipid/cholesterol/gamma-HCH transport system substrate-binding protein
LNVSNELKIGAMTLVALVIAVLGFYYLKGVPLFKKTSKVYVLLDEAAGVSPASPVAMHGIRIGKVNSVSAAQNIIGEDTFNVVFNIYLDKKAQIPKNSVVSIVELDLLGNKELRIVPSKSTEFLASGDTIQGTVKGGMMAQLEEKIDPLIQSIEPLITNIDTLIYNVNTALMGDGEANLDGMILSLSRTLKSVEKITARVDNLLASQSGNFEDIIENADKLTASIAKNSDKIDSIIANFTTFSGKLSAIEFDAILNTATETLDQVKKLMAEINDGDGTIHKLFYEDGIYKGLDSTLVSINSLIADLQANPKRYVSFSLIERKEKPVPEKQ